MYIFIMRKITHLPCLIKLSWQLSVHLGPFEGHQVGHIISVGVCASVILAKSRMQNVLLNCLAKIIKAAIHKCDFGESQKQVYGVLPTSWKILKPGY